MKNWKKYPLRGPFLLPDAQLNLLVRQATVSGRILCRRGGLFDASYPNSPLRRARVQGVPGISSTIMAGASEVYLFENVIEVKDDLQNHTP